MRTATVSIAILSALVLQLSNPTSLAGQESGPSGSTTQGRALVDASLAAMGGEALANLRTLSYDISGYRYWLGQGRRPETEASMPLRGHLRLDYVAGRVREGTATYQGSEPYFCFDTVIGDEGGLRFECVTMIDFGLPQAALERGLQRAMARLPQPRGWLQQALDNAATLRRVGERTEDGQRYEVVTFTDDQGTWTLYIDAATDLLARVEGSTIEMLLRSETVSESFSEYQTVGGVTLATHYVAVRPRASTIGSVIRDDLRFTNVQVNEPLADSVFARPGDLRPRPDDGATTIREVAPGVYFLENIRPNYNQLFVEFGDFILAVDAPYDADHSMRAIAAIREQVPDKPIRYVVPTHAHYDHMGGVPAYVTQGATVLTTPGNSEFVGEVVRRALSGGEPGGEGSVDVIGRHFVISDSVQTLELYDIGPNPHADELLILYLPQHRILYVPDVFSADWGRVRPAIPETVAFAAALEELGLDVDVILPSHGAQASMADLEWALSAGGEAE